MSDEEFDKKVKEVEANIKVIKSYDELFENVKKAAKIIVDESEVEV